MFKKYIFIKQKDDTDCGIACLSMISKFYGVNISISKLRNITNTDLNGTTLYELIEAAKYLGFNTKAIKGDRNSQISKLNFPVIAHIKTKINVNHYIVIYRITKKHIVIADPAIGIKKISLETFLNNWTGVLILLTPNSNLKKSFSSNSNLISFGKLILSHKKLIFNICLSSILYTLLGILGSFYFKILIDEVLKYDLTKTLNVISIGMIILTIIKLLLVYFRNYLLVYLSQRIDISLMLEYYNHVIDLPKNFFNTRKSGEIISRFNDASKIRNVIAGNTLILISDLSMSIFGGIILYIQNPLLFSISLIILFIYIFITILFNKQIKSLAEEEMEKNAKLTSHLIETINGIETIKVYTNETSIKEETEEKFIDLLQVIFKSTNIQNIQSLLINMTSYIGNICIMWIGSYQVLQQSMTIGQLIVFNSLLVYFIEPIKNVINLQQSIQNAIVAYNRLSDIFELETEHTSYDYTKINKISLKGNIKVDNLYFGYKLNKSVLKNINLEIKSGEKVAFVGLSGSGKTTLAKLFMRFFDAKKGDIYIDECNIKDISLYSLRQRISYITQDTFIFNNTIKYNLSFGNENTDLSKIMEVSKLVDIHNFINDLPSRYDSLLSENGQNLSGGQKQKISIARAIIKNSDILILDEATSNLDAITEKIIEKTIFEENKLTTILIAHRLSTIVKCDKIFVFENGEIVETGNHYELFEKKGSYYNLCINQNLNKLN